MPLPIQLKRSGTASATPSSLEHGELALNYADSKVFWKNASNTISSFTFQSYALSSHTHAASDITSGTLDAARIANDSITYAKLQNVSTTDRLLGRSSAGAGDVEEITCTAFGRSLIDDADAAAARTTLSVQPTASPAFTGTVLVGISSALNSSDGVQVAAANNPGVIIARTAAPSNTNSIAGINATAYDGSAYVAGATINFRAAENWSSTNHGTDIQFRTTPTGSGGSLTETLRLTAAGQLLVTAGSGSAGSYKPGIAVSGDDDTGLQQVGGANTISLVTQGSERVRVESGGRVILSPNSEQYGLGVRYVSTGGPVYFGATSNSATPDAAISAAGGGTILLAKNDGEVIVGGTTDQGAYNLQCNGTGVWGAGAYVNGSDERIKDDITPLGEATSVIAAMQPVTFRYKPTWSSDRSVQPGFVAQQLQEALAGTPYIDGVVQQGTEYLSVAYQSLIPLLIKALQESNARIAALEEKLNHA